MLITCGEAKFWEPYLNNHFEVEFKYSNLSFTPNKIKVDIESKLIILTIGKRDVYGKLNDKDVFKVKKFKNDTLVDLKTCYTDLKRKNKIIIVSFGNTYMAFTDYILERGHKSIKYYTSLVYYLQEEKGLNIGLYEELCRIISDKLTDDVLKKKSSKYIKGIGYVMDVDELVTLLAS